MAGMAAAIPAFRNFCRKAPPSGHCIYWMPHQNFIAGYPPDTTVRICACNKMTVQLELEISACMYLFAFYNGHLGLPTLTSTTSTWSLSCHGSFEVIIQPCSKRGFSVLLLGSVKNSSSDLPFKLPRKQACSYQQVSLLFLNQAYFLTCLRQVDQVDLPKPWFFASLFKGF